MKNEVHPLTYSRTYFQNDSKTPLSSKVETIMVFLFLGLIMRLKARKGYRLKWASKWIIMRIS